MCIIFLAYKAHPQYEFVVAANRDEEYSRPSSQAAFWEDYPQVLAGRDLLLKGTWMGVTKSGRFAALTNYPDLPLRQDTLSRGELVKQFLISDDRPYDYLLTVQKNRKEYNGFNLLVGDSERLFYYSKHDDAILELSPGVYGLSNASLNTPWPKVQKGIRLLKDILREQQVNLSEESLLEILRNTEKAADLYLPNRGFGLERERLFSSIFIESPDYGTRSSTLLTVKKDNLVEFIERTFEPGKPLKEVHYSFKREH